jgi:hypothetical protein
MLNLKITNKYPVLEINVFKILNEIINGALVYSLFN